MTMQVMPPGPVSSRETGPFFSSADMTMPEYVSFVKESGEITGDASWASIVAGDGSVLVVNSVELHF
jgi:hypothetical protein